MTMRTLKERVLAGERVLGFALQLSRVGGEIAETGAQQRVGQDPHQKDDDRVYGDDFPAHEDVSPTASPWVLMPKLCPRPSPYPPPRFFSRKDYQRGFFCRKVRPILGWDKS